MNCRTRVKICGITRLQDAQAAICSGADAIGLVFYEPSPRNVSIDQAAQISKALPAFVTKTALFVDASVEFVEQVLAQVDIDLLQFHGDESAEYCCQFNRPYIKAVRMRESTDLEQIGDDYNDASGLLLDAYIPGVPGGTGEQFNWQWVPKGFKKPIILAGGLSAENVGEAIKTASPYAVDISGGVEEQKGIKSADKIQKFMQVVQLANSDMFTAKQTS